VGGPEDLRALLLSTAAEGGLSIDVDQVLRRLEATARAFERRRAAPEPLPAAARRRRLSRLVASLLAVKDELHLLGRDESRLQREDRLSPDLWDSPEDFDALTAHLERVRGRAELLLARAERPARRGGRRDEAVRSLVLETAWILTRAGLAVSTYEDGLLARVARDVATWAGRRLPDGENVRRTLRPAVAFCRRQGVRESTSGERFDNLMATPRDRASSPSDTRH
jgi:hypothetical protein